VGYYILWIRLKGVWKVGSGRKAGLNEVGRQRWKLGEDSREFHDGAGMGGDLLEEGGVGEEGGVRGQFGRWDVEVRLTEVVWDTEGQQVSQKFVRNKEKIYL